MAKPHVAIVCTQHRAGDTRMFQRWVCGLAARGWRVTHIAPPDEVTLDYPEGAVGVLAEPPGGYLARITSVRRVLPLLDRARPDLILFPDPELFAVLPGHGRRRGPSSLNGQIVTASGCGALFWASEIGPICDQIEVWMDDPDLARVTGQRGRDHVLAKLVWEAELERLEPWLASLCGTSAPAA